MCGGKQLGLGREGTRSKVKASVVGGGDGPASKDGRGGMYKGRRGGRKKVARRRRRRWRNGCAKGATVQRKVARSRQDVAKRTDVPPMKKRKGDGPG